MKLSLETEGQDCEADHDPDEVVGVVVQISVYAGCQCSRTGLDSPRTIWAEKPKPRRMMNSVR